MASRFGSYSFNDRGLGERSYTGTQVLTAFVGLLTAAGLVAGGAIIISQNEKIKTDLKGEGSDFNLLVASIFIIAGSLLLLFGLFKMFTKTA